MGVTSNGSDIDCTVVAIFLFVQFILFGLLLGAITGNGDQIVYVLIGSTGETTHDRIYALLAALDSSFIYTVATGYLSFPCLWL